MATTAQQVDFRSGAYAEAQTLEQQIDAYLDSIASSPQLVYHIHLPGVLPSLYTRLLLRQWYKDAGWYDMTFKDIDGKGVIARITRFPSAVEQS